MSRSYFDYSLTYFESTDEELDNLMQRRMVNCNYCNAHNHTINFCPHARTASYKLHKEGINTRNIDLEYSAEGNSVKFWIKNLTFMQIIILSNKINIFAYAADLFNRNMISEVNSLLLNREDYNLVLFYFYYIDPIRTFNFPYIDIKLILDNETNEKKEKILYCPICLENKEIKEFITMQCNHNICHECIKKYIYKNKDKICTCSLCRENIQTITYFDINNYENIKSKFLFNNI